MNEIDVYIHYMLAMMKYDYNAMLCHISMMTTSSEPLTYRMHGMNSCDCDFIMFDAIVTVIEDEVSVVKELDEGRSLRCAFYY